jgi:hypothetical protein
MNGKTAYRKHALTEEMQRQEDVNDVVEYSDMK